MVEGRLSPAEKERFYQALPHLLALEALSESPGGGGEAGPELGLVEAYGRYLEERNRKEEALLARFGEVLREVEREALEVGA